MTYILQFPTVHQTLFASALLMAYHTKGMKQLVLLCQLRKLQIWIGRC